MKWTTTNHTKGWPSSEESDMRKHTVFHQDNARLHVYLMTRQKLVSLAGNFWFIHHIYQRMNLQISTHFCLYHILLTETILVPWKTVKGTWSSSLLNKIKCFGKMELGSCLKMAEGRGTKQWICCSIKFLVKVKNVSYLYLKTEGNFWPTPIFKIW